MSQIKTLRENSTSVFGKLTAPEMKRQLETLKYIELVAMQANIPLDDLNILEIFRAKKGSNKLVTATKEINKRLFKTNQVNKELILRANLQDVMSKEKIIKANFKRYAGPMQTNLIHELENIKSYLRNAQASQNTYDIKRHSRSIERIEKRIASGVGPDRLYKDIGRVVMNGFWRFVGSKGTKLRFITTSNIVLFDKNVRTKMNLQKDFGTFLCQVDIRTLKATIRAWRGNTLMSNQYLHPYVSGGNICFGNAQDAANQAIQERDLYTLMNIVGMVIGTYNGSEGPHVALASFVNESSGCRFLELTVEAKKYYAQLQPVRDPLKEFMQEVGGLKKVGNRLASSIGNRPEDASDVDNDDDNFEDEFEEEEPDTSDDEGYF